VKLAVHGPATPFSGESGGGGGRREKGEGKRVKGEGRREKGEGRAYLQEPCTGKNGYILQIKLGNPAP
jgi:hypothetical protein